MALNPQGSELFWRRLDAARVVATIQVGGDAESGLGAGGAGVVEDLLVGVEGFTRPVPRHLREEAVFDGIPFGGTGRVVGHGDRQRRAVRQLRLDFGFPGAAAIAVAAPGVGEDEKVR
jgi:hypothetical protein